jgi:hypothetical protein
VVSGYLEVPDLIGKKESYKDLPSFLTSLNEDRTDDRLINK